MSCFNCPDWRQEVIAPQSYAGVVISVHDLAEPCKGAVVIRSGTATDTLEGCNCGLTNDFWSSLEIGDSLLKPWGSTDVNVVRAGDERTFEYPCCDY